MQLSQPACIADIGFAPRHILGIARIHQDHMKAPRFQNFERRDPVDAGRFHRHARHAARVKPIGKVVQVLGECPTSPDRHVTGVGVYCGHVHGRSDIDRRCRGVDHLQIRVATGRSLLHGISSDREEGRGPCKSVIFLTGITAKTASPLSSAHQPMCHVF